MMIAFEVLFGNPQVYRVRCQLRSSFGQESGRVLSRTTLKPGAVAL